MSQPKHDAQITEMLVAWGHGDHELGDEFVQLVYDELRRQARRFMRRERPNHTLETTELVHEAYLKLIEQKRVDWQNRSHFFGLAAQLMRRILVKYAIKRNRQKRGGVAEDLPLEQVTAIAADGCDVDLEELDQALNRLAVLDARQTKIVELRYFSGLNIEETADVLDISPATVKRDWLMAKTWLKAEISAS